MLASQQTAAAAVSQAGAATGIVYGVNGHDGQAAYPYSQAEARFKLLSQSKLRSYRFNLSVGNTLVPDLLIPLAKKYGIILRPMIYPASQAATYSFVKRYANDIKIWEIGNEQSYDRVSAQARIDAMVESYRGVRQASDELQANLKTSINFMACDSNDPNSRCYGDPNGDLWFIDMAAKSGFAFDYITYHYYPRFGDKGVRMDLFLGQMKNAALKYQTRVFFNETSCQEVFYGNIDGGYPGDKGCYDITAQLYEEVKTKYADVVLEMNAYEMLDEPNLAIAYERHFGLLYDMNHAKEVSKVVLKYASGQ